MANVMQPYQPTYLPQAIAPQAQPFVQPAQPMVQPQLNNTFAWVSEEEAKAYPVAPGNSVFCIDMANSKAYFKSTDWNGLPAKMRVFRMLEEVDATQDNTPQIDMSPYATIEGMKEYVEGRLSEIFSHDKKKGDSK